MKTLSKTERQSFVRKMLLLGDDGLEIPDYVSNKVLVEHVPTRKVKRTYTPFRVYMAAVALGYIYWAYGVWA